MFDGWRDTKPIACPDDDWQAKWAPPCPEGNPQRLLEILGFRLKGADYLQLRVVLRRSLDNGVCQAVIDEHPDRIYVRAIACLREEEEEEEERPDLSWIPSEEADCPCNWWLDAPLAERVVIDVDTGAELPLYIPRWGTGEPSLYVPRPPGLLWPPAERRRAD
jgi:hypothetical protein